MTDDIVDTVLRPLYGLPAWNVHQGYSSFLTLEFGQPHLEIDEPRPRPKARTLASRRLSERRLVHVKGEWHLWIYFADWVLYQKRRRTTDCFASDRRIARALLPLDGQALVRVEMRPDLRGTIFTFDLGGRLETAVRDDAPADYDQWMLFEPSGEVLVVRADGQYSHEPGDTPPENKVWLPLPRGGDGIKAATVRPPDAR